MSEVIAIAISDLHLSLLQPVCRADKDWLTVQAGYLDQVKKVYAQQSEQDQPDVPILCAGDLFDRWNPPPELIHFALEHLPDGMMCVPGQHDLPNHRIDEMHRSGYGVLKKAGKIRDLSGKRTGDMGGFVVQGFGWGQEIKPVQKEEGLLQIALIHRYVWTIEHCYPGAPEEAHLNKYMGPLKGYDVAIFGDNHRGFSAELKTGTAVLNCGGFIRRKSDEINYVPTIGLIYSDGSVERKRLNTLGDVFHENPEDRKEVPLNMAQFIEGLEALGEHGLNFREAVENHLRTDEIDEKTKEIILKALETT